MAEMFELDPKTLRWVANDIASRGDHLAQCCGGSHTNHRAQIAAFATLATELRSLALRVDMRREQEVVVVGGQRRPAGDVESALGRLRAAGLDEAAARTVAAAPGWGPVSIGPGIVVSMFAVPDGTVA